ncbi:hypothetical protein I3842_03G242200 [Carya illinoinensis]|uniref:Uncharacterized protein n=1 Tax=Carya illinoinensis TaxID=32201 RepID=A0A922FNR2_CARIL|nr:hypothetical protein I3842_03G242200 [Carya illinoinensis]
MPKPSRQRSHSELCPQVKMSMYVTLQANQVHAQLGLSMHIAEQEVMLLAAKRSQLGRVGYDKLEREPSTRMKLFELGGTISTQFIAFHVAS